MKNQAIKQLVDREDEYLQQSILMLYNDEIHTAHKTLLAECVKLDEDETETIKISDTQKIFEKHSEFFNPNEIEELIRIITK